MDGIDTDPAGVGNPALSALRTGPGDGHLYAVARDGRVWTSSWRDCWRPEGWLPVGSSLFPTGANVIVLNNRLRDRDLFVLGRDGRLWNTCWVTDKPWKQWRRWEALGQRQFPVGAGVAAVTVANTGDVAAFVVDRDGRLWTVRFPDLEREAHGHWSAYSVIDGPPLAAGASVCAISSGQGSDLAVLALGRDGRVWTVATTWAVPAPPRAWGQWTPVGGLRAVSIRALRHSNGASGVVAVGEDERLYAASAPAGGTWVRWKALGRRRPALDAGLVMMAGARGEQRVVMLDAEGRVWTNLAQNGTWGGWAAVGARRFVAGASLAALGDRESEHRALVLDVDGLVWTNALRCPDERWDGWSEFGESALPV